MYSVVSHLCSDLGHVYDETSDHWAPVTHDTMISSTPSTDNWEYSNLRTREKCTVNTVTWSQECLSSEIREIFQIFFISDQKFCQRCNDVNSWIIVKNNFTWFSEKFIIIQRESETYGVNFDLNFPRSEWIKMMSALPPRSGESPRRGVSRLEMMQVSEIIFKNIWQKRYLKNSWRRANRS